MRALTGFLMPGECVGRWICLLGSAVGLAAGAGEAPGDARRECSVSAYQYGSHERFNVRDSASR